MERVRIHVCRRPVGFAFQVSCSPEPSLEFLHGHRPRPDFFGSSEGNQFGLTQVSQGGFLLVHLTGRPIVPSSGVHWVAPSSHISSCEADLSVAISLRNFPVFQRHSANMYFDQFHDLGQMIK